MTSSGSHTFIDIQELVHLDFFKKFAELSRGNLFEGSAEFYQPANNPSDKVKKYNAGVGRIQFQDQTSKKVVEPLECGID